MRRLFTAAETGLTNSALRLGVRAGRCVRVQQGISAEGGEPPTAMDRARAKVLASGSPARGALAGVLLGLDSVELDDRPTRRDVPAHCSTSIVQETLCADALTTLLDLARVYDDDRWEQVLESALRAGLVTVGEVAVAGLGIPRVGRVLARRPAGTPPTESLMETLMVQLARSVPLLGELVRQYEVRSASGLFVARLDLCRPDIGLFLELDGQQHAGQPVYDARRETAVVAATGMVPGRFTWYEVTRIPRATQRRLGDLAVQASIRWRRAS